MKAFEDCSIKLLKRRGGHCGITTEDYEGTLGFDVSPATEIYYWVLEFVCSCEPSDTW